MNRSHRLLTSVAFPLLLALGGPGFAAEPAPAEAQVDAARQSLEKAQKSLDDAEGTGGDIRAARRAVANAMKALRAAESAGTAPEPAAAPAAPTPATPAPVVAAPTPKAAEPVPVAPAPVRVIPMSPVASPTPPPVVAAPAPAVQPKPEQPKPEQPSPVQPKPYQPPEPPVTAKERAKAPPKPASVPPVKPVVTAPAAQAPRPLPVAPPVVVRRNGLTETTVMQPDGMRVLDVTDRNGRLIRRIQIDRSGNETVLIDTQRLGAGPDVPEIDDVPEMPGPYEREVPPPPGADGYILNGDRAGQAEIESTLGAAPIRRLQRGYSMNEIRRDPRVRDMMRRVDLDTITFETGSARVPDDQVGELQAMGRAMARILDRRPDQVFLIEGHTDAVGSAYANLDLSDRRAASVAQTLTRYFGIPEENLVTQGYGEQYLKIPTEAPERENRRVTVRNITPLLNGR